jgi:hypothetical protein
MLNIPVTQLLIVAINYYTFGVRPLILFLVPFGLLHRLRVLCRPLPPAILLPRLEPASSELVLDVHVQVIAFFLDRH